jgi:hypothetical protein
MKKTFSFSHFVKILVLIVFMAPFSSFAANCPTPVFSSSFPAAGYHGYTPTTLPGTIVGKFPNGDWCSRDNLCPAGVAKTNGGCATINGLKGKWQNVVGADAASAFFDSYDSHYYTWKLCSACVAANGGDGSGQATTTTPPAGTPPAGTPPPAPGTPTTVAVLEFDKLENPLGPANLTTVSDVIERALGIIIKVSIPFVVLMLIWTGFQFVIAQGNEGKLTKAKNTFLWVIVGAAILIGCVAIANAIAKSVECVASVAGGAECN